MWAYQIAVKHKAMICNIDHNEDNGTNRVIYSFTPYSVLKY
jgi:hypothetical protein